MLSPRPLLRLWSRDTRATTPERWAMIAGGIAVACVVGVRVADVAVKQHVAARGSVQVARATPDTSSLSTRLNNGNIDYTVTASIASPAASVHLDPCNGQAR